MAWWTCAQINTWERARRTIRLEAYRRHRGKAAYRFVAERPLPGATLLFLNSRAQSNRVERYGFAFQKVEVDLEGEKEIRLP